jgi:hypothetical protein
MMQWLDHFTVFDSSEWLLEQSLLGNECLTFRSLMYFIQEFSLPTRVKRSCNKRRLYKTDTPVCFRGSFHLVSIMLTDVKCLSSGFGCILHDGRGQRLNRIIVWPTFVHSAVPSHGDTCINVIGSLAVDLVPHSTWRDKYRHCRSRQDSRCDWVEYRRLRAR